MNKPSSLHAFINEIGDDKLLLTRIPCSDCGAQITPQKSFNQISEKPVLHSVQLGRCHQCGTLHFVVNARTKEHCIALEPSMKMFVQEFQRGQL